VWKLYVQYVGVGFMGRGMLRNIVKKTNAEIVSIYDVNPSNIDNFMDSLTSEETVKVRICRSPADVS
jgi:NADH/NAD ratio-sensing transcriptional regulator Rex